VVISYQQTIRAYPKGASAYLVASGELGKLPGLTAAASLLNDYVLTVSVSIAAGVAALSSIFAAPTYVYSVSVFGLLVYGMYLYFTGTLPTYTAPPEWNRELQEEAVGALSILLVLRAFASGAVGLSGTEAISDGVPAFKPPEDRNARITLLMMAGIFGTLFLGISFLAAQLAIVPDPSEARTVLSQLVASLVGSGPYFWLVQVSTAVILVLAANTAFADFPRLSYFLARDSYLPHQFTHRGDRLAFSTGILALAVVAGILLVLFRGSVTALIPLYTLGVFTVFTLSQSGMVAHWRRQRGPGWKWKAAINGLATITLPWRSWSR
ncbi:MAG: amino acid permease, partial [Chloroflexia bacterium]